MSTGAPPISVVVVESTPGQTRSVELGLVAPATVADALQAAAGALHLGAVEGWAENVGIFGKRCTLERLLCEGDRVELYRPLAMDAKSARRLRARSVPIRRDPVREKRKP